jgi:alpha-1,2-mannosyltransferase
MPRVLFAGLFLWLTAVLAVGAGAFGLPRVLAIVAGAIAAAISALFASRALHRRIAGSVSRSLGVVLVAASTLAVFRIGTLAVFMADVHRVEYSIKPDEEFRRSHSCFSAYAESARFADEGQQNIYERALYIPSGGQRSIGPLKVDPFHYPPPFLLLPEALRVVAPDFWDLRRLWFAMQALTLAAAVVGLAGWIGGMQGGFALLAGILVLASPHTAATLQQGNFQITAIALALVAIVLLMSGLTATGSGLLAYAALAKIFPGVLVVPLIAARRWRLLAWIAAAGAVLVVLTVVVIGMRPFQDFVSTALPDISSGAAFPQADVPAQSRVNWSAYGETVRLRQLGVSWLTAPRGLMLTQLYGLAVVALAAWVGWKRRFDLSVGADRLALLQVSLALVSLASFRSPFVGVVYGSIGTLWAIGLTAASMPTEARRAAWFTGFVILAWSTWLLPAPGMPAPPAWVWISGLQVLMCIAANGYIAFTNPATSARAPQAAIV